jgi:outer membrane protein assembly factor BamB
MVGSGDGHLFSVDSATGAVVGTSSVLDVSNGVYDAPLVDSSAGMVYAFAGDDGSGDCPDGFGNLNCSGVFQFPVHFTSGSGTETTVGSSDGSYPLFSGAFDNIYFNSNASSPTGSLYVCGQADANLQQNLYQIVIGANVMGAAAAGSYAVGNGQQCSPVTEFYNASVAADYVFLSSAGAYQGCAQNAGCLYGFNVTSGTAPDNAEFDAQSGGTSGIIVDNYIGSGTLAGASQLYFATLSPKGTCATSGGVGICAVQDSQLTLNYDWSQFHSAPDNNGFNQYEIALSPSTVGNLGVQWSYTTGNDVTSSVVVNGVVYFGSDDHNLYALSAATGSLLWSFNTGSLVESTPAVANGVVYIVADINYIDALDAGNGALLWSYGAVRSLNAVAVANGVVYASGTFGVLALNAGSGALLWSFNTDGNVYSSPAVANGMVYAGGGNNVYAIDAGTGTPKWSYTTGGSVDSAPAVANGVVYVGSADHNVYALNASTGALVWSFPTDGSIDFSSPAVANAVVYIGSLDHNVYALNAGTGALMWHYTTGSPVNSSPAVANGVVYVGSSDDNIYALNASTGALLWSYTTGGKVGASPAVANGMLYVGSEDYNIYAFALP